MTRSAWIISPVGDFAFLIATPLAIVPIMAWLSNYFFSVEEISLVVVAFASIGHHLPGFMRAYGDRELFQRFRRRFIIAPPVIFAVAIAFAWLDFHALSLILLFWTTWHVLMQTYGFMRIYDVKRGRSQATSSRLDFLLCLSVFVAGVVFSDARVYGIAEILWRTGFPFFRPQALHNLRICVGVLTGTFFLVYVLQLGISARKGIPVNWLKVLLVLTTGWLYWTSGAMTQDILLGVAMFEIFHAIQYNAIVWAYNHGSVRRDRKSLGVMGLLFQDRAGMLCIYLAAILAFGSLSFGKLLLNETWMQQLLKAALVASTILHFYYDGFIWKVSERTTQANLAIETSSEEALSPVDLWHVAAMILFVIGSFWYESRARDISPEFEAEVLAHLHALTPELPEVQTRVVQSGLMRGESGKVLPLAYNVVRLRPHSDQAHSNLGLANLAIRQYQAAANNFHSAIKLAPEIWQNHSDLGTACSHLKNWEQAEKSFSTASHLNPHSAQVQQAWARMCELQGDPDAAISHWEEAFRLEPDRALNSLQLARLEFERDQLSAAQTHVERAIQLDPKNAEAHFLTGNLFERLGDYAAACTSYRCSIDLNPQDARAYANLATALSRQGANQHAEKAYRRSLEIDPDNALANYNLGLLLQIEGHTDEARRYLQLAQTLGHKVPQELFEPNTSANRDR